MGIFINASKNKRRQRIIFAITAIIMAAGLVGATLIGAFAGGGGNQPVQQAGPAGIPELEKKAAENPEDVSVLFNLARAYYTDGQVDKALQTYQKALEVEPAHSQLRISYALTCFLENKYDKAIEQMEKELQHNPGNNKAHFYLGQFWGYGKKDYAAAVEELQKFTSNAGPKADTESINKAQEMIKDFKEKAGQS